MNFLYNWLCILVGIVMASVGAVCLKVGAVNIGKIHDGHKLEFMLSILSNPMLMAGIILYIVPTFIWIWLLKSMPLTTLQPAMALTYVVSAVLAIVFLGEVVSLGKWIGIFFVILGVIVVSNF